MFKKPRLIILLLAGLVAGISLSNFAVYSETRLASQPRFWLVTTPELSSTINPLLDRYITDITPVLTNNYPGIVVEKKSIILDPALSANRKVQNIITTLENGFHEERLIGALIIGTPLPKIKTANGETSSTLPYGDFEHKYYTFVGDQDAFVHLPNAPDENIQPEILLGYLPDLGIAGFETYFNAHHSYFAQESSYNKAIFFNDEINDTKLWTNLDKAVLSPLNTQAFNPNNYQQALDGTKRVWQESLQATHRWQSGTSITSSEVRAHFDNWYNEPALSTLRNILPAVANYFLDLEETTEEATLSQQENAMGEFLSSVEAFSTPIAIQRRFFKTNQLSPSDNIVCTTTNPLPATDSDLFRAFRTQFNSLETWITNVPRGSLFAQASADNVALLNGIPTARHFIIRPGNFVNSANGEPITLKTILFDPSVVQKELTIPRTGFNHPGVTEVTHWSTVEINNDQINELIGWHYFLNKSDQYLYYLKNRLPALNQYAASPDTYEIAFNVLDKKLVSTLQPNCLTNRSPETRTLVSIFAGFSQVDTRLTSLLGEELASGKSLAVISLNSTEQSNTPSFDRLPLQAFSGLANPPLFTSFASGSMLGKSILPGLNEIVNLFGDPCITLRP